jgi:predicted dehydrogenase
MHREKWPKIEDNSVLVLSYRDGVAILEGSWNFPRGIQDLELFGPAGSLNLRLEQGVVVRKGKEPEQKLEAPPLGPELFDALSYMAHCLRNKKTVDGMVGLDLNVGVMEVIEAAKTSVQSGKAVALPLP